MRSATEVAERRAEKLVMLGPVLERLHDDLLEPLIGRVFQIMARAGQIPPPPFAELDGLRLQPEYVSPMQALQAAAKRIRPLRRLRATIHLNTGRRSRTLSPFEWGGGVVFDGGGVKPSTVEMQQLNIYPRLRP